MKQYRVQREEVKSEAVQSAEGRSERVRGVERDGMTMIITCYAGAEQVMIT